MSSIDGTTRGNPENLMPPTGANPISSLAKDLVASADVTDRPWLLPLGVSIAALGLIALYMAIATTFLSVLFIGAVLIVSAVAQGIYAFQSRGWKGALYHTLIAILYAVAGFLIMANPIQGAVIITAVLAFTMLFSGALRMVTAVRERCRRWGVAFASGLLTLAIGAYVLYAWPVISLFMLGVIIGVDLVLLGLYLVILASSLRNNSIRSMNEVSRNSGSLSHA